MTVLGSPMGPGIRPSGWAPAAEATQWPAGTLGRASTRQELGYPEWESMLLVSCDGGFLRVSRRPGVMCVLWGCRQLLRGWPEGAVDGTSRGGSSLGED